jgi:hypothetical protein
VNQIEIVPGVSIEISFQTCEVASKSVPAEPPYCVTVIVRVPLALSVVSVPVIVTVPVVPPTVPLLPLEMVIMLELLEVNVVELVLSVPFSVAVKVMAVPVGLVARLMVVPKLEVRLSEVDCPTVRLMDPETTEPLEDWAAA